MIYGLIGIGIIFFVLFLLYKVIRFAIQIVGNGFQRIKEPASESHYLNDIDPPEKTIPSYRTNQDEFTLNDDRFVKETSPSYRINQNEFTGIVNKTAYRHPRVENVKIKDNVVFIEFSSQSGLSRNHAKLTFTISGANIGEYSIVTDNYDSSLPSHIARRIQTEIRRIVGIG